MTGTRVSAITAYAAPRECTAGTKPRGHRVRELVCSYRPVRDHEGRIVSVPSLALSTPHAAAQIIAPLMADEPVEMFAVACLSAKNRLLAWHIVSRGTRSSTPVSIPDVFVPACVTPGTVSLLVVHYVARHIMKVMFRRSLCGGTRVRAPIRQRSLLAQRT